MPHPVEIESCACRDRDPNDRLPKFDREDRRHREQLLLERAGSDASDALSAGELARLERWRVATAPRSCPRCRQPVEVQIWGLSVIELMLHEWRAHGFITGSIGGLPADHPGRAYALEAGRALFALSERCPPCHGVGIATASDEGWRNCPECHGVGRVPTAPLAERVQAHRRWFGRWPKLFVWSPLYGLDDVAHGRPATGDSREPIVIGVPS